MESSRSPSPKMIPQPLPLLLFPAELLLMISSNLSTRDVGRLALTNRFLNKLLTPGLYTLGAHAKCSDTTTNCTPLHWAARHGRLSTAKLLISRGAKRDVLCIARSETPLHQAVRYGHLDLVKYLFRCDLLHIKNKCSKEDDFNNSTPLCIAARWGHDDILSFILTKCPELLNTYCCERGNTPLHCAVRAGHISTVETLLRLKPRTYYTERSQPYLTPLHVAVTLSKPEVALPLLNYDQNLIGHFCPSGHPILNYAFLEERPPIELIKLLISHGADPNARSRDSGQTSLHYAAMSIESSAAGECCEPAEPSTATKDIIQLLLDNGATAAVEDYYSVTPLHYAASWQPSSIPLLLDAGAEVNHRDEEGQTPLFWAAERGRVDTILQLLERGADINAVDGCKMSPLSRACAQCSVHVNTPLVKMLVEKGADIHSKDELGMTALHHAAREGHMEIVDTLLKKGAKASVRDGSGENALDMAMRYNKGDKVVDLLRRNMGMISWDAIDRQQSAASRK